MANNRQYRSKTLFVGTRGVKEYRASIPRWVNGSDTVLEIGCEWGTTTTIIAEYAATVIGTDVSPVVIERARERHPHIRFKTLDAFDVRAALELNVDFNKIYIDMSGISGYRSLLDLIALLNSYAAVLRPEAIVVKSGALKHFASRCIPFGDDGAWQERGHDNQ